MKKKHINGKDFVRTEAEKRLSENLPVIPEMSCEDMKFLIHELHVHQIELEMQNDALQQARIEIEQNANRYIELFNLAPVAYLTLTNQGKIQELNKIAVKLLASDREKLIGKELYHFISEDCRDIFYKFFRTLFSQKGKKIIELKLKGKKNNSVPVQIITTIDKFIEDQLPTCKLAFINMTEQKKALEIIKASIEDNERLAIILDTQEQERKRIAETLHNGVGQLLYSIKIKVDQLTKKFPQEPEAKEAKELIKEAIDDLKSISYELVPTILEDFGLEAVLNKQCRKLTNADIKHTMTVYGYDKRLPLNLEVAVFRIIQELLNNVIKHSYATLAGIFLTISESLIIRVEDNGRGIKEGTLTEKMEGMGLRNIKNRVKLLGGDYSINSESSKGTLVLIKIPLAQPYLLSNLL